MNTKISMVPLGCPKNQVDGEIMLSKLKDAGFVPVEDAGLSDVVIVNTCGFIESAKQESIDNILELCDLKNEGRIKKIIITGCLAERYRGEIFNELPEVDAVVGLGSNKNICEIIKKCLNGGKEGVYGNKNDLPLNGKRILANLPFYAYLKIADGCDNRCSYCAIPGIRGNFRSRKMEDIISEAEGLAQNGIKELIIVAQDSTRYGEDIYGEYKLPELLRCLCKINELHWIRILYCYPERITDELIDVIAAENKIIKYIDIPFQHVNKEILSNMNRQGDIKSITALIEKLRKKIPGITIRTSLIAGFPGETEEQFEELAEFVKNMEIERLGCFPYSAEEGTPAALFDGQIEQDEKERRAGIIMREQMNVNFRLNEKKAGEIIKVIVEGYDRLAESFFGRSEADAPEIDGKVFFICEDMNKKFTAGEIINVLIDETYDYDLIGRAVTDESAK